MRDALIVASCALTALILFLPRIRLAQRWRATVTPLASIIGSGFLVSGPLLARVAGSYAVFLMMGLCFAGYAIGAAVRYNIINVESAIEDKTAPAAILACERLGKLCLAVAYLISICFYIQLLSSFLLKGIEVQNHMLGNIVATLIIAMLGVTGFARGFSRLEFLEEMAVTAKLAVIAGLLVGLVSYDVGLVRQDGFHLPGGPESIDFHAVRISLGALLIVQGFETSRYLGHVYGPVERERSMHLAQVLSSVIYVAFILLATAFLDPSAAPTETAIIEYARAVAATLPPLLILGAIAAQFSAATADFVGSAGLVVENFAGVSDRKLYPLIAALVIVLTWTTSVFEILTIASRTFAAYYFLQCAIAMLAYRKGMAPRPSALQGSLFLTGLTVSAATLIFGIPAH